MNNKKGISQIISIILIIFLTILAGAVLIGVLTNFTKDNLEGSTDCLKYEKHFQFEKENANNCYNSNTNPDLSYALISINAKSYERDLNGEISTPIDAKSFEVVFTKDATIESKKYEDGEVTRFGGNKKLPLSGEIIEYRIGTDVNFTGGKAQLFTIIGKDNKVCGPVDTVDLGECT